MNTPASFLRSPPRLLAMLFGLAVTAAGLHAAEPGVIEMALRNVKTPHDAAVFIALGTDSGAMPTRIAGFGEHRELRLLVRAGLPPAKALVCATAHGAAVIGQEKERGTLEAGKRADFIVLDGNPLDDIGHTTQLAMVWHGGAPILPLTRRTGTNAAVP